MSLYAAEAHSRTDREEILLSRLFGTLDILDREIYLADLMKKAGIEVPPAEYPSVQIQFWPEIGACSPDVVVEGESFLIYVVGARRDRFDREKLNLLADGGWKLSPRFHLLVITDGEEAPPEIDQMNDAIPTHREAPLRWLGWPSIYLSLYNRLKESPDPSPARGVAEDLLGLLAAEGRAPFVGFEPTALREYREVIPVYDRLHASVGLLLSDLDTRLQGEGIRRISPHRNAAADRTGPAPRSFLAEYADETWDPSIVSVGELFLDVDCLSGEVRTGFRCNLAEPSARALLVEGRNRIADVFRENEEVLIRITGEKEEKEPGRDTSLLALLETQNGAGWIEGVEILSIHDGTRDDLVPLAVQSLTAFRDIALSIPLLPIHRVNGESPFVVAGQ